jgi:hypothetical protein
LQEEESHDVGGTAVQLGSDVLRGRAALDDDLAVGHRALLGCHVVIWVGSSSSTLRRRRRVTLRWSREDPRCRDWAVHRVRRHPARAARGCAGTCPGESAAGPPGRTSDHRCARTGIGSSTHRTWAAGSAGAPGADIGSARAGGGGIGRPVELMGRPGRRRDRSTGGTQRASRRSNRPSALARDHAAWDEWSSGRRVRRCAWARASRRLRTTLVRPGLRRAPGDWGRLGRRGVDGVRAPSAALATR